MKRVTALLAALLLSSAAQAQLAQDLGPGGTSSLATLSAATAPGTWSAEWKDGFLSGAHTSPNGEDPVTSNGIRGVWYSGDKTIHYYGHGHSGFRSAMLKFDDTTATWTSDFTNVPLSDAVKDSNAHQFTGFAGDPATGRLYFMAGNGGGNGVYRREPATLSWTAMGVGPEGNHGQVSGAAFMPTWGAAGSFINGSLYGVVRYDVSGGSETIIWDWDDGDASTTLVKVTSRGHSVIGDVLPTGVFLGQANTSYAVVTDGYVSTCTSCGTSGRIRRPLLLKLGVNMWRQDGDSTWTSLGVAPPSPDITYFYTVVPDYDCIVLWIETNTSRTGDLKAYVYRHALADEG